VRAIGLKLGDEQTLSLAGPDGQVLAATTRPALTSNQAQGSLFVGKRLRSAAWPTGRYRGSYIVRANGRPVLRRDFEVSL
jgi:hypothetical protein